MVGSEARFLFWVIRSGDGDRSQGIGRYRALCWKTRARMPPEAKVDLTPKNILFLTPKEYGRRGHFYFGLDAFKSF